MSRQPTSVCDVHVSTRLTINLLGMRVLQSIISLHGKRFAPFSSSPEEAQNDLFQPTFPIRSNAIDTYLDLPGSRHGKYENEVPYAL